MMPNMFVVGAPRAGTTAIYDFLAAHPNVYMSPIKEPNYFVREIMETGILRNRGGRHLQLKNYLAGPMTERIHFARVSETEDYLALFRRASSKSVTGEASSLYLQAPACARAIKAASSEARILIGLRNPVERAFSEYTMNFTIGLTKRSFVHEIAVEKAGGFPIGGLIAGSLYHDATLRYLETFGPERVLIFCHSELNEPALRRRICDFLAIDGLADSPPLAHVNRSELRARNRVLNYLLQRSGIKEYLSLTTPQGLKTLGKRLYYRKLSEQVLSDREREMIRDCFVADLAKLGSLVGRDITRRLE
jgi:hypothetical protein